MSDSNLHTCERSALGWQNDGPCKQCELEDNFAKFGGNFGGKPVPSGTQDEREREIRERQDSRRGFQYHGDIEHLLSLLDAERKTMAEVVQTIKDCCDRDWKDEKPTIVATICSNAMFWRNREIRKLRDELDAEQKRVAELQEYEDEEAKFMAKRGVLYNCTFIDGWAKVLDERDELKERVQELEGSLQRLINCPAMIYTSFSDNPDIEHRVHKQCICCTAHKGQPHIEGCHIAEAESLLSKEQTK